MREKSCVGALFMPQRFRMRQDLRFCGPLSSACAVYVWSRAMGPKVWAGLPCAAPVARCPGAQSRAACMVPRYAKPYRTRCPVPRCPKPRCAAPVARCPGVQSRAVRTVPSAPVPKTYRAYGPRTDKSCAGRQILLQFRDCRVYMKKLFHSTPFLRNIYPL